MEPEAGNAGGNEIVRSGNSVEKSFVMFVNGTSRIVSVYWMDFSGNPKLYIRLRPNAVVDINTFRSHAWIFRDAYTGERFQVQRQSVFWAQPYFTISSRNQNEFIPVRKRLLIHFPLRTLRENVLWYVMRKLKSSSEDAINQCDLPKVLKDDLILVVRKVVAFRTTNESFRRDA